MFLVMAVPAVVYGGLAFTIPESPRYLVAKYRIPEARRVLTMLLGEKNLEITITRIQESLKREEKPPSWRDLRKPTGGLYGIVWVGLGLSVFQQFVGINVIFYYSNVLWEAVGFSARARVRHHRDHVDHQHPDHADRDRADRQGRAQAAAADRLDRHGGHAGHDGGHLRQRAPVVDGKPVCSATLPGPIALIAANLFVVAFGMSWGPVVWVLLGEMFPNRIRAAALGLAAAGQWVANWLITVTFPALREHLGLAYGFYAAVRGAVGHLRLAVGAGDQGHAPGGHARRGLPPRDAARRRTELPRARRETAVTLLAAAWNNRVP